METTLVELRPLTLTDLDTVVALIGEVMDNEKASWAHTALSRHFQLQTHGFNDGRTYFAAMEDAQLRGISGLHYYDWGPRENVWLGWFAVQTSAQGQGLGKQMLRGVEAIARAQGHRKLLVETYDSPVFAKAHRFYAHQGYTLAGKIHSYFPEDVAMIVLQKSLTYA
jgi:GNAT superfamily N-acetyltransferase